MDFVYGQDIMTIEIAERICSGDLSAGLNESIEQRIRANHQIVQTIAKGSQVVYGINSGFGPLCTTRISPEETKALQSNILKSHSAGVGNPIPTSIAKLMLITKVQALAKGYSGISLDTLKRIIWHINEGIIPLVPEQGSVGASGDLAPLAHLFLPLIGLGKVIWKGETLPTSNVLEKFQLEPIALQPKEGLALINGTQFMLAYGIKVCQLMKSNLDHADLIGAMMLDGLTGSIQPFDKDLHELRPYAGTQFVAARFRQLLRGSAIMESHHDCERVQDPYSLRCIPQVHGASYNAYLHIKEIIEIELNSITDNPIIFNQDKIISGGHFHGQPIAMPMDYATLATSEIGNISDRRVYLSLSGNFPDVPQLLLPETGVNSGFMILQYTTAALASENKSLCYPASADSIPTSLGQEDHVSMGSISGRKALRVNLNLQKILAIELMCAAQALDFHVPQRSSEVIMGMHSLVRKTIPHVKQDEPMAGYIEAAIELLESGKLIEHATSFFQQLEET